MGVLDGKMKLYEVSLIMPSKKVKMFSIKIHVTAINAKKASEKFHEIYEGFTDDDIITKFICVRDFIIPTIDPLIEFKKQKDER